ncbi:hypothetical protein [Dokdonella sp.]|uniref:hypothetical protein n=1 Tax=Dokdonella sp. TaxID=2291710 RepID=UPI003C45D62C
MKIKALLAAIAVVEFATGAGLVFVPSVIVEILLGHSLESEVALVVARIAGLALIAMGLVCWFEKTTTRGGSPDSLLTGLLVYNIGVPVLLVHGYLAHGIEGVASWPAVAFHLVLAAWLAACLRHGRSAR